VSYNGVGQYGAFHSNIAGDGSKSEHEGFDLVIEQLPDYELLGEFGYTQNQDSQLAGGGINC
jgi:hypothetical protein